jgi:hypothetical protein
LDETRCFQSIQHLHGSKIAYIVGGSVDNVIIYDPENHKTKFLTNLIYPSNKSAVLQVDKYLISMGVWESPDKIERINLETAQNEALEFINIYLSKQINTMTFKFEHKFGIIGQQ